MSDKFEDFLQFTDDREAVSVARKFDLVCHAALLANCPYLGYCLPQTSGIPTAHLTAIKAHAR